VLPAEAESGVAGVQDEPDLGEGEALPGTQVPADAEPAHADAASPDEEAPAAAPLSDEADAPLIELAPPPPAAPTFEVLPGLGAGAVELPARWCEGFEPSAAAVLNITQDHLDWHGGHGRLCRGQGPHLRQAGRGDGDQPRRP
jgi:UDP-N-acetylmuramoylalanine--D-glutamate ligase